MTACRLNLTDPFMDHIHSDILSILKIFTLKSFCECINLNFIFKLVVLCVTDCSNLLNRLNFKVLVITSRQKTTFAINYYETSHTPNNLLTRMYNTVNTYNINIFNSKLYDITRYINTHIVEYE